MEGFLELLELFYPLILTILLFRYLKSKGSQQTFWLLFIKIVLPVWAISSIVKAFTSSINTYWYNYIAEALPVTIIMSALPLIYLYYRNKKSL